MLLRVARYDAGGWPEQLAVGPQPVDHGIGQRHTQVIVLRVWSQKLEGQHGYSALARDSDWQDSFGCRGLIRPFHAREQAVATARQGFDKARIVCGVAQRLAQLVDGRVHAVIKGHERVSPPEPQSPLFARDHLTRPLKQHGENLERLPMQLDSYSALPQFAGPRVHFERAETEDLL